MRRAVVTGMGVVSALGHDPEVLWSRLEAGACGVGPLRRFDASAFPTRIAAEVLDFEPDGLSIAWRERGRIALFAAAATRRALADAGSPPVGSRAGIVLATGMGTYAHAEVFAPCALARAKAGPDWEAFNRALRAGLGPRAAERRTPGSVAAALAREHGLAGPVMSVMTACAGGTQAVGDALRWIRQGRADVVVAGGADSEIYPMGLASFCLLGALSTRNADPARASRPFDAGRDGFVLGEGAAVLVLEEEEHARRRGARIRAEVMGFGSAADAWRATDPHPQGRGAILAMTRALADAGIAPDAIDYVNAHGTSTGENDRVEALALHAVFGGRRVPVSSTKSMLGHLTVAAGAIEAVATVQTLVHQTLHPTVNQETPDPECDLDVVPNRARAARVEMALSNSFAFGGQTASLVLGRARL